MKRTFAACVLVLLPAGAPTVADDLWIGKLPYRNVTVVGLREGNVVFVLGGRSLTKPLADVTRVRLEGREAFNRAEALLLAGRRAEAVAAYEEAGSAAARDWERALIRHRRAAARRAPAPATRPAKTVGPTTRPSKASGTGRCYYCNGTGWMPCPACRVGHRNTGKSRCPACTGTGRITCPDCKGTCCTRKCPRCGGTGQIVVGVRKVRMFVYQIREKCPSCGGTGYADYCPTCGDQPARLRGTVPCPTCGGTGFYGECLTCKGSGHVPCPHCEAGKKRKAEFGRVAAGGALPDPEVLRALATPEGFVGALPERVDYEKMTTVQRRKAAREYDEKLRECRRKFTGRGVRWMMAVRDVAPAPDGERMVLQGVSAGRVPVRVVYALDRRDALAAFARGAWVIATGRVAQWLTDEGPALVGPHGTVKLAGEAVGPVRK